MNFQMFKLDLEKAEEPEIKLPTSAGLSKKQEFQKNIYFCFIDYAKAFDCVNHINCGKFLKRWKYQATLPVSWEICMQVKKQQLQLDMEQQTGSKSGKEYIKAVYCHPAYLTSMKTIHHAKCWAEWRISGNQDAERNKITSDMQMHHPYGKKWRTKELDESEREEWESWPKTQHSENEDHGIWSHYFIANRRGSNKNSDRLNFGGAPKSLYTVTVAMKLKDAWSLEEKLWQT